MIDLDSNTLPICSTHGRYVASIISLIVADNGLGLSVMVRDAEEALTDQNLKDP